MRRTKRRVPLALAVVSCEHVETRDGQKTYSNIRDGFQAGGVSGIAMPCVICCDCVPWPDGIITSDCAAGEESLLLSPELAEMGVMGCFI